MQKINGNGLLPVGWRTFTTSIDVLEDNAQQSRKDYCVSEKNWFLVGFVNLKTTYLLLDELTVQTDNEILRWIIKIIGPSGNPEKWHLYLEEI